jgi:hypothetical protein
MFLAWNLPNMCGRQEYHGKRFLVHLSGHALPKKSKGKSHYVYNQKTCGRCHGVIQTWKIAQRTVYACEACQPPPPTISQSVTVKRRRAASICSTRLGGRDDTLDTEDTSVEDNVDMTVTTSKYWKNMMNPFLYLPILLAYV